MSFSAYLTTDPTNLPTSIDPHAGPAAVGEPPGASDASALPAWRSRSSPRRADKRERRTRGVMGRGIEERTKGKRDSGGGGFRERVRWRVLIMRPRGLEWGRNFEVADKRARAGACQQPSVRDRREKLPTTWPPACLRACSVRPAPDCVSRTPAQTPWLPCLSLPGFPGCGEDRRADDRRASRPRSVGTLAVWVVCPRTCVPGFAGTCGGLDGSIMFGPLGGWCRRRRLSVGN